MHKPDVLPRGSTPLSLPVLVLCFLVMVLAGLVKGIVGFGLPAVGIGLLSLFMAPPEAAAIIVVPAFITNVWQFFSGPHPMRAGRRFAPMMIALVIGTLVSGFTLGGLSSPLAQPAIGVVLILYAVVGLAAVPLVVPLRWEGWLSPVMGFFTGIVTGMTGVSVLPSTPYLKGLGLDKDTLVEAMGLTYGIATVALAMTLLAPGVEGAPLANRWLVIASALALLPAVLGMELGGRLRRVASPATFTRLLFLGLGLLGAYMMARGLMAVFR